MTQTDFNNLDLTDSTLKNINYLKLVKEEVVKNLGDKYKKIVTPYIGIITITMNANNINEFEALKKIKETLSIYKKEKAPMLFSAALIEVVETKYFEGFKN